MENSKLESTFEQDTKKFINEINDSLIKLENDGYSVEVINHIFRCIHSIKSEAAYLSYDKIASAAHDMESVIEPLRNIGKEVEVDPALIEFCFKTIDVISSLSIETLSDMEEKNTDDIVSYTDFELMLMKEARSRGEKLYMLTFGIAADESMKYPRAYLAISNLENKFNVIKVSPDPDEIQDISNPSFKVRLSTSEPEIEIAEEINIDQIVDIRLFELSYDIELKKESVVEIETLADADADADADAFSILPEGVVDKKEPQHQRVISVEADEIDAISESVSELKKRLSDLSSVYSKTKDNYGMGFDIAGIETISTSVENMMLNLQTVDFNNHFAGYRRTARDIAARLGKKVEMHFDEGNIRIQREFADFIAEPLLQVIRNAVVHGIELPAERTAAGKSETGRISIKVATDELSRLTLSISDDGSGIDETLEQTGSGLLDTIVRPGFTTLTESEQFAGRGVGLDLVKTRILRRGGVLELINKPGEGCEFKMIFAELKPVPVT